MANIFFSFLGALAADWRLREIPGIGVGRVHGTGSVWSIFDLYIYFDQDLIMGMFGFSRVVRFIWYFSRLTLRLQQTQDTLLSVERR